MTDTDDDYTWLFDIATEYKELVDAYKACSECDIYEKYWEENRDYCEKEEEHNDRRTDTSSLRMRGEAEVIKHTFHNLSPSYGVECTNCHAESWQFYNTEAEAITAWNRAMGATDTNVGDKERIAKVETGYKSVITGKLMDGHCMQCGRYVMDEDDYYPGCGARLEWK